MATTYRTIASLSQNGPLASGSAFSPSFNRAVLAAEQGLPEGAYVELTIDSVNAASAVVSGLNGRYQTGQITYPGTGELIQGWPGYPGRIAFLTSSGNGAILRWRKGQPWVWILLAGLLVVAIAVFVSLERSNYSMKTPQSSSGGGGGGGGIGLTTGPFIWFGVGPKGTFRILNIPWYWVAGGMALGAVGAVGARVYSGLEEGEADVLRGRRDIQQARGS